jgi:hypothetical protein
VLSNLFAIIVIFVHIVLKFGALYWVGYAILGMIQGSLGYQEGYQDQVIYRAAVAVAIYIALQTPEVTVRRYHEAGN